MASVAGRALERATVGSLFPVPPELLPYVCAPLSLVELARVATSSRAGCVIIECLPAGSWKERLDRDYNIGLALELYGFDQWRLANTLRQEVRFWSEISKPLDLSSSSGPRWLFSDIENLKAGRGMGEDTLALLHALDKDDVFGPWSRMPWMPQCSVQRLVFSFDEVLDSIRNAFVDMGRAWRSMDAAWESKSAELRASDATVPCALTLQCISNGSKLLFDLSLQVALEGSSFPTSSRGVHKALVVYLFTSSPAFRAKAPRCVSYEGNDGSVSLLSGSIRPRSDGSGLDFAKSKECKWVDNLLCRGELQALAVIDCVFYVT